MCILFGILCNLEKMGCHKRAPHRGPPPRQRNRPALPPPAPSWGSPAGGAGPGILGPRQGRDPLADSALWADAIACYAIGTVGCDIWLARGGGGGPRATHYYPPPPSTSTLEWSPLN